MNTQGIAHRLVGHCMTGPLISIGPYATLAEAYSTMCLRSIRRLPVLEHERLTGIVTRSDILEAKPSEVGHAIDFDAVVHTLGHAAELMLAHKIGGLPVLNARDEPVGMITESDLFRLIAAEWRDDNEHLPA